MIEHIVEQLKYFILDKTYKKRYVMNKWGLTLGLEKNLGISGDHAEDVLYDYGQKYKVNIDDFKFDIYFSTDDGLLYWIYKLFPCLNPKKKELTIGDLVAGIKVGRLDEDVINASKEIIRQNK